MLVSAWQSQIASRSIIPQSAAQTVEDRQEKLLKVVMVCLTVCWDVCMSHPVPGMTRLGVESRASPSRVGASLDR